jgi:DNA gyrase subunit A
VGVSGVSLKEGDYLEHLQVCSSHDYLLFFTNFGKVYRLKVYQIPESSRGGRGRALVNFLPLKPTERVQSMMATRDFTESEFLVFATRQGVVKKTAFTAYHTPIRSEGIIAMNIKDGDELISVRSVDNGEDVILFSRAGQATRFSESKVRVSGRNTSGVRGMRLRDKTDYILNMNSAGAGQDLLVVTENGYGKRTPLDQYPLRQRGSIGVKTIQITEQKGGLAAAVVTGPEEGLFFISREGMVQRIQVSEIPTYGRTSQGVRLMNLREDDRISTVALVEENEIEADPLEDPILQTEEIGELAAGL